MRIFCLIISVFLGAILSVEAFAGSLLENLRAAEAKGFQSVAPARIEKLVTAAAQKPGKIEMSRSWIDRLPKASGGRHWRCLSEALYFEARGETVKGQFAVAEVIMNRVKSARFPDNVCAVINQGTGKRYQCQFTYTCDGNPETIHEKGAYDRVGKVARLVLDGAAPAITSGATHYHTTAVRPRWSRVYTRTARYGVHLFYRHTFRTAKK